MRSRRLGFVVLIISAFTAMSVSSSFGANPIPERWQPSPPPTDAPSWGIWQAGNSNSFTKSGGTGLLSFKAENYERLKSKPTSVKKCFNYPSIECPKNEYQTFLAAFGKCSETLQTDCVDEISAIRADGTNLVVKYLTDLPGNDGFLFKGNKDAGLPSGSSSFLVEIPDAPHSNGNKYLIDAIMFGDRLPSEEKFRMQSFEAQIYAVSLREGKFNLQTPALNAEAYSILGIHASAGGIDESCIQLNLTTCAQRESLPKDIKFSLKFKLSVPIDGWLHGRASNVEAIISSDNKMNQELTISANPVQVPTLFGWIPKESTPEDLKNFYAAMPTGLLNMGSGYCQNYAICLPYQAPSLLRSTDPSPPGVKEIALWLPILKDKAVVAPTIWNIRSMEGQIQNSCSLNRNSVLGIVSTNATSYLSGPPTFNTSTGTLDYLVLAPHYLQDDSVFLGSYDLAINSDLARCIYGFTSAPIQASISVVSANGQTQVATTSLLEKNGFILLSAKGFEFSNPTLKVTLSQEKNVQVQNTTPVPVSNSVIVTPKIEGKASISKKTTITCTKGKATKKVTGINPKCPVGYKKYN